MLRINRISKRKQLDLEITDVTRSLIGVSPSTEEYATISGNLEQLYKIRNLTVEGRIKMDTIAMIGANLMGIVLILKYEELDVISTKAMSFVMKGRV